MTWFRAHKSVSSAFFGKWKEGDPTDDGPTPPVRAQPADNPSETPPAPRKFSARSSDKQRSHEKGPEPLAFDEARAAAS